MKKPLELALLAGAGLGLFSLCFVGFAAMSGVPMHGLPVIGSLFEAPQEVEDPLAELSEQPAASPESQLLYPDKPTASEEREILGASLGVIGSFAVQAPFDRDELADLVAELETRRGELELRFRELDKREAEVESQVLYLQERSSELERVRESIEERFAELELERKEVAKQRADLELGRAAVQETSEQRIARKALLFAEGEPEVAALRLVPFGAEEAGQLLRRLEPERARAILDALPAEHWSDFADAYTNPQ